jgi:glucokinase
MTTSTVAVDLGGTHIRAALVDGEGAILTRRRTTTPSADPKPTIICSLIAEVMAAAPDGAVPTKAVIGVPGVIDHEAERLVAAPNLTQSWIGYLNEEWLQNETGLSVSMANDADLAAVGEASFGAGRDFSDVVYITISTGVGAGLVVGERLVRGTRSGGELGHTVIDRLAAAKGEPCTVEDLGSGTAIERLASEAGLVERGAALAELAAAGSQPAADIWTGAIEAVGFGIANLAWIVGPEVVIIGGGVGMNHDLVVPIIERQLRAYGPATGPPVVVDTAKLGDDAALAGSASWWKAVGRG